MRLLKHVPTKIRFYFTQITYLLSFYTLIRLVFFFYNYSKFKLNTTSEILSSFVIGLRFDLSALLWLNLVPFLLLVIPKRYFGKPKFQIFYRSLIWFLNAPFIMFNLGDVEFSNFTGRRMTTEIFKMTKAFKTEALHIVRDYPLFVLFLLGLFFVLWKFNPRYKQRPDPPLKWAAPVYFISIVLIFLGIRGGLQLKPLQIVHAYTQNSSSLSLLSLNTTFTLIKGKSRQQLKSLSYLDSEQVKQFDKSNTWDLHYKGPREPIKNVVIILLESFALEYMGLPLQNRYEGFAPYLDSLTESGLYLTQGFANGRRSIEAIPSILCSLPSLMSEGFISSYFQSNDVFCLPEVLKAKGFRTGFFHGAENGTMYFDSFADRIGFDGYYGLNEYPSPGDFDKVWGIYDEPYLQYFKSQLDYWESPFFAFVFTLSSHHPYKIPEKYQEILPSGKLKIHQSIAYADMALKRFFESAKKSKWFDKTLFIITGDHTQKSIEPFYSDDLGKYRVPFVFFHPDQKVLQALKEIPTDTVFQHIDIFPTLLDMLGIHSPFRSPFGQSLFSPHSRWAFNGDEQSFIWTTNGVEAIKLVGTEGLSPLEALPIEEQQKLLYLRQSFNNRMLNNQLYLKNPTDQSQ